VSSRPLSPEHLAKLERQRKAAEEGAQAMQEVAAKAAAIRANMARLRELRLAEEARAVSRTKKR
jgi:hypothetical protein